jgi:hypothetical protein
MNGYTDLKYPQGQTENDIAAEEISGGMKTGGMSL